MSRFLIKTLVCLTILCAGSRLQAFSLLGEFDDWQTTELGFRDEELGGSKDLGEEFRINIPTLTYGFDSTFLDYFGAAGVKAIDQAFAIMNKLPRASKMSPDLSEFLLQDAQIPNETARTLTLLDLKSETLQLLLEHLGLIGEEHVYDLQKRVPLPGTCQFNYQVIIRNFDPITYDYTPYVNGALYTYVIVDRCPVESVAFAAETTVDPTDIPFNAVASLKGGLRLGGYYIGLTRDDAGGLRYIYRKNNYNNERLSPGVFPQSFYGPFQPVDFFQGTNNFPTNTIALRPGVEKITFKKARFNSLLGTTFKPFVQSYQLGVVTNFDFESRPTIVRQNVRRLVSRPDILFTAGNLNTAPAGSQIFPFAVNRTIGFTTNGLPSFGFVTSVGPGTINPETTITFHKASPQFYNGTPFFLDEATALGTGFRWGSFDGSTNDPIVYPQSVSIRDLERQVLTGQF